MTSDNPTTPVISSAAPIRISRHAEIVDVQRLANTLVVLCDQDPSRHELLIFRADMIFVRSREEFMNTPNIRPDAYLVLAGGLSLARDLVRDGLIESADKIIWAFERTIPESLGTLQTMRLSPSATVCAFAGSPDSAILVSEGNDEPGANMESFLMGLAVSPLGTAPGRGGAGPSGNPHEAAFRKLADKHLNTLQSLGAPAQPGERSADRLESADAAKLENDLILLKRRYDALNRKYNSLASSRLGQLTLRIWELRRVKTGTAKMAKENQR